MISFVFSSTLKSKKIAGIRLQFIQSLFQENCLFIFNGIIDRFMSLLYQLLFCGIILFLCFLFMQFLWFVWQNLPLVFKSIIFQILLLLIQFKTTDPSILLFIFINLKNFENYQKNKKSSTQMYHIHFKKKSFLSFIFSSSI